MIVEHNKSKKRFNVSVDNWNKLCYRGDDYRYTIIEQDKPKELKAARANKTPGIDHNEGTDNPSPIEDTGANT